MVKKKICMITAAMLALCMALAGSMPLMAEDSEEPAGIETMEIHSTEDLLQFAGLVNEGNTTMHAELMNDIDLSGICSESAGPWTPITDYEGVFNGNGHVIRGLYCAGLEGSRAGLFGSTTSGSVIQDLNMEDVYVEGRKYAAGIVADGFGTVSNCTVSGYVKGAEYAAGVCAGTWNVYDCVNYAEVLCDNEDDSFTDGRCGGVAGVLYANAENCSNYGAITGMEWVTAGVIGGNVKSPGAPVRTITNCFNYGPVDGYLDVGGVVGYVYNTVIQRCGNNADVTGMAYIGGVLCSTAEKSSACLVINCYNKGNISGKDWGEGNEAIMTGRFDFVSEQRVAGIASSNRSCQVCNCYSWGSARTLAPLYSSTAAGITTGNYRGADVISNCYTNMEFSNAYGWDPMGIGLTNDNIENCFYVNGLQSPHAMAMDMVPGQAESELLDGTVLTQLNAWPTEEGESSFRDFLDEFGAEPDEWVQGEKGPVFAWE